VTTVLVVEDEFLVMMSITADLIAEGYDVLTASNADKAIEILESRNDIETIFTDIEMPGSMDGLKLAQAVRYRWPPVNIVITSGKPSRDNDIPKNVGFVAKPYDLKDVLNAFRAFY
jgi:two-component system, response regulator PdtaR